MAWVGVNNLTKPATDMAVPDVTLSAPGTITAHDYPGHGFAPDPDRLAACTVSAG